MKFGGFGEYLQVKESGLFMFDGTNWHNYNTTNSSLPNGLHGNLQITSIGDKWLLTGSWPHSEVIQFKDSATVYHDISNSPLMGNHVSDIDIDDDGKMWIADHGNIAYRGDRKSTRLNSSHVRISYAVFCLKKKK